MHFFLPAVFLLLFIDFLTKSLAKSFLLERSIDIIPHFFTLSLHFNTGIAFSFPFPYWAQMFTSFVFLVGILYWARKYFYNLSIITQWGVTFLISGAFGNFWERIVFKEVTDFLFFYSPWFSFPVFNFADVFIFIGVLLWFFGEKNEKA